MGSSTPLRETAGALDAFNLPLVSVVSPHSDGDGADDVAQGRRRHVISSPSLQIALFTSCTNDVHKMLGLLLSAYSFAALLLNLPAPSIANVMSG